MLTVSIKRTALKYLTHHTNISNTQVVSIVLDVPNAHVVNVICDYLVIVAHVLFLHFCR